MKIPPPAQAVFPETVLLIKEVRFPVPQQVNPATKASCRNRVIENAVTADSSCGRVMNKHSSATICARVCSVFYYLIVLNYGSASGHQNSRTSIGFAKNM
jgi:hypothetical protein